MTSETSRYSTCDIMDQSILAAEEAEENYACLSELAAIRKPRYKLLDLLGKGPCGRVFKARNTYSNHIVAVKVIETNDREWVSREGDALFEIKKEVRRVNSSSAYGSFGLLEVLDVVPFLDTLWMVSPLCTNGSLKTLLDQQGPLSDIYIISVMRDAGRGLFWLHSQDTFHGNVKAANILINEKGSIRLCDFDIVIRGEVSPSHSESAYHGSLHWLAPECLVDRHGSHKGMDIWSFGALAYELATGSPPYATLHDATTILHHLERFGVPTLTGDHYSGGLKDLLSYCFVVDASRRPCMNLVFSHSYLSSTAVSASILDIVNKYLEWEDQQSVHHPQEANQPSSAADNTEFEAQVTGEQTGDLPEKPGSEIPEMNQPETAKVSLKEDPLSESEGELSTWSVVDEPSRCSSPFDLEHILLRTRTLSLEDIEAIEAVDASYLPQDHPQSRYARGNHKDASVEDASNPGDVPITVGMSISQGEINALSNIVSSPAETSAGGLDMDFNVVFNPGFDVFASQPVDCNSSWNTFQGAPRLYAHAPSENTARNSNSLWAPPAPIPCHWQTPPVSPSSSPSRTAADHSLAVVPAADNRRVRHLPPTSPSRYEGPLRSAVEAEVAPNDNDDDDDTSTLRARDSNPVNLEQAAAAAPRTPPTTPNQMVQSKGKEPASSPDAWPPYNLPNRSTNNIPLQILSPPPTPAILKPLPPLPKPKARSSTSQHRPSTSGGSSSGRLARYDLAPPVPSVPGPVRRPSLDIFSAVSYDSFGPSFDGNGNYIAPPAPLSPTRPFGALAIPTTQANTLAPRPKGKSPVLVRERMIPREAGSCPPRRRKSHPPTKPASTNRGATSSSSSHVPTPSSSSTSSSSASRSKIKPPPRNASFSVFPTSQSSSLAAAAQAATKARNLAISGSSGDGGINLAALPPRRPSAPLPTTQRSFFDYDADEDSDSEEYEIVRGGAADFKKGVKRIVNSVSANLGDTIRGLETAPRKGFRWMKRSSP